MSETVGEIQEIVRGLIQDADPEYLAKGYETAKDQTQFAGFGGRVYPTGEYGDLHVTVRLQGDLTEWLGERDMLSYTQNFDGDLQKVSDPSFVLGGIIAALEVRATQYKV